MKSFLTKLLDDLGNNTLAIIFIATTIIFIGTTCEREHAYLTLKAPLDDYMKTENAYHESAAKLAAGTLELNTMARNLSAENDILKAKVAQEEKDINQLEAVNRSLAAAILKTPPQHPSLMVTESPRAVPAVPVRQPDTIK